MKIRYWGHSMDTFHIIWQFGVICGKMCCHWPPLSAFKCSKWFFKCNAKRNSALPLEFVRRPSPRKYQTSSSFSFQLFVSKKRCSHRAHCLPLMYLRTTSGCSSHVRFYFETPHILNNEYVVHVFLDFAIVSCLIALRYAYAGCGG